MRLAYVCADPGVPVFGTKGCSIHVCEVLRALSQRNISLTLLAARVDSPPPADLSSLRVVDLPVSTSSEATLREQEAFSGNRAYQSTLEREGPFDLIFERYSLWSHAGMSFARSEGIPGILEVNAPLVDEASEFRGIHDRSLALRVAERAFGDASRIVAVSRAVADYVAGFPGTVDKVIVLPNGVDSARFTPSVLPTARKAGAFTIGFVGSLKPWHGVEILVDAFAEVKTLVPDARLLIVGDGPVRPAVERKLEMLGLGPDCHFTGRVSAVDVPGLLTSMDVGVAPAFPPARLGDYFSPLKVFEYMAAGLPTVCSRSGQMSEIIDHGVSGLLFQPGDSGALAEALIALAQDGELRRRLAATARRVVEDHHTWQAIVGRILGSVQRAETTTGAI